MRTKIDWPSPYIEMSGMDRFCGGPAFEDRMADDYLPSAKRVVNLAIQGLEQEIDNLQLEVDRLKNLVSEKPRIKYNSNINAWVLVDASEAFVKEFQV